MKKYIVIMNIIFLTGLFFGVLCLAESAEAANHYVRVGASGSASGADWTNAYPALPSSLTRGDTYYVAGGTYGSRTFSDAESGSSVITIKKATVADHGTNTGWSDAYGTAQAVFAGVTNSGSPVINFQTGYYIFDGNGTIKVPTNNSSDYGFKIYSDDTANYVNGIININGNYITVRHTHIYNTSSGTTPGVNCGTNGVKWWSGKHHTKFQLNYFENSGKDGININSSSFVLIEKNWIKRYGKYTVGSVDYHGQAVEIFYGGDDIIFRWNMWEANEGQGLIQIAGINSTSNRIRFYGNVVFVNYANNPSTTGFNSSGGIFGNAWNNNAINDVYLYNNTIVNIGGSTYCTKPCGPNGNYAIFPNTGPYSNWYNYNNLFYNVNNTGYSRWTAYGYHASGGGSNAGGTNEQTGLPGSILKNYTGNDYHLAAATTAGLTLTSQPWWNATADSFFGQLDYDTDMDGNVRGADGTWDRGAYEYMSGGGGVPIIHTVMPLAGPNGSISPNTSQTFSDGTTAQFSVTPNAGFSASVGGTCGGSLLGTTYTTNAITTDCTVSATFTSLSVRPSPPPLVSVQ